MAYDLAKVTDAGNNLVASILANKSSLSIDKIEVSDTQLPSTTDITKLTSIPNVVQTIQGNGFSKNDNTLIISSVLDNSKVSTDYKAWVFGVWGSDSQNGKSILMAVITSTTSPDTIPAYSGSTPVSYTYKFNIGFSNAGNVQFNMINGSFATNDTVVHTTGDETVDGKKTFKVDPVDKNGDAYGLVKDIATKVTDNGDNSIEINKQAVTPVRDNKNGSINFNSKDMTPADDSAVVHTTGDETINGQKKFKTDPTDSAGNAYAKTVDVNQQLDKKVNISDMRKPASDVVGLEDVSTSVYQNMLAKGTDIHTVTKDGIYPLGFSYVNFMDSNFHWGTLQVINNDAVIMHIARIENGIWFETRTGSPAQWQPWHKLSFNDEVAHLSGANNFDTVPTVNNNPLLLASSLPPDLARTGQANTFTAAQTFSIAPTIKDASKDKGDNQAATMADLKSIENSAWHDLKTTDVNGSFDMEILYQKIVSEKQLRFIFIADYKGDKDLSNYNFAIDLSKIITKFQTPWSGDLQVVHAVSDDSHTDYDFYAHSGSSLITCSQPITLSKDEAPMSFATSFITTRTNGELNDTFYVDGFKS